MIRTIVFKRGASIAGVTFNRPVSLARVASDLWDAGECVRIAQDRPGVVTLTLARQAGPETEES